MDFPMKYGAFWWTCSLKLHWVDGCWWMLTYFWPYLGEVDLPPGFFGSWRCGRGRPSGRPGTRRLLIAVSQLAMVYSPMIDDDRWFIETLHSTTSVSWWSLYVSVVEEGTFGEVESQRHFPRCCREEHMGLICPSLLFGCHSRYFILFYYTIYIYIYVCSIKMHWTCQFSTCHMVPDANSSVQEFSDAIHRVASAGKVLVESWQFNMSICDSILGF